ncbi:hypothetical protein GCM10010964_21590 [Caldovatus sediminis]|uniref:DUF2125 domain-containing protein n=1 Tax=Caldovatus sediminis TaxID=2041189 RepID=A0A8J2ZAV9_9PROT|nr:DUF2125 domain-containing protein [Caldovatus sediminis]GGG33399.1 hypothetical protein GCM10010964_21590 [Caldovatus sediminis]
MPVKPHRRAARPARRASLLSLLALATLVLAALAAGHALLWRWTGDRIETSFEAWARTRRATGWQVEHGPPQRGGWPFAATLRLPGFRLAGGGATLPGGMDWQAEALVLRVALPRLDRLVVEAHGRQRLRLAATEIPFAADRLEAALPLAAEVLPREADLRAERLRLRAGAGAGALEVERAQAHLETSTTAIEGEPAVLLAFAAEGITLPPRAAGGNPLPRRAESLAGELVLSGPVPLGRRDPVTRAEAWRDAGGTLELRSIALRWGPVGAEAQATLTLDEALQPMGAGTVRVSGVGPAIEALAAEGALTPRGAATARTVLALLARTPAEGGPSRVELPITLEDRTLSLGGRLQLARLPPLAWPSRPQGPPGEASPAERSRSRPP